MTNEEHIYELVETIYNLATTALDKTTRLKEENNKLKQQIENLENFATDINVGSKKPKRKLRAMTIGEWCKRFGGGCDDCPYLFVKCRSKENEPCKPYGKYILIEVKE